ncbi:PWWP domain-containing protein 5 [Lotus japonicus]|uniref:PWWP domain-containing protein 5 n=1 Tax=Lotus japonicus TaxID=34305 RepID=UPI0025874713|nr:PWWP domain-containing protein 5 [Lotus japonicus]
MGGSGGEGFGEENEFVGGRGNNGLEAGVGVVVDGKEGEFSCGLVKDEDGVKIDKIQCSGGPPFVYEGVESGKGLFFKFNGGVQNGVESVAECEEVKNVALVNSSSAVVEEDDSEMEEASLVRKDRVEDSQPSEVATYKLQDSVPFMDVDAKESVCVKDLSTTSPLELETSHELKQPTLQVDLIQNRTAEFGVAGGAGLSENVRHEYHGFNLVVDFNAYANMQEVGMYGETVFSEPNYRVSDLVWGKVKGHPWWPGQIFDHSAASEKAKRHFKEDCYLIAYFGDQTFSWNDVSTIKPFQMHFSQLVKQDSLENFHFHHAVDCALDEVSRRVEFGLSCPCMSEVFSKLETQAISNAGVRKQLSRRSGEDRFINSTSFDPLKLVNFVKSLAQSPLIEFDRLDSTIASAQLLAFYRSKGYSQLPGFTVLDGLYEKKECDDQVDEEQLRTDLGFSQTSKYVSQHRKQRGRKRKLLSDLMSEKNSRTQNGGFSSESKGGNKSISQYSGRKRKAAYNTSDDYFLNSRKKKLVRVQNDSIHEMWSQLCLASKNPLGESCSSDMGMSLEQMHDDGETEIGVTTIEVSSSMTTIREPCNDSYWTDRIVQREELSPKTPTEANPPSLESQPAAEINQHLDSMQQDTDTNVGSEPSKVAEHLEGSSNEGISPTALTLKFTSLDSVPSIADLNKIFERFGPLIESKTELLEKTNRARVVFRRRSDAETAFSSAGKYSIFGPSLVSYRLKILPQKPKKTGKRGRKSKKETSSAV